LSGKELNDQTITKINEFRDFINRVGRNFDYWKQTAKQLVEAKKTYYKKLGEFNKHFLMSYERDIFMVYNNGDEKKNVAHNTGGQINEDLDFLQQNSHKPSIEFIYHWIKEEGREMAALMEAIEGKERIYQEINKTKTKQRDHTTELQNVLAGKLTKSTVKGFFSKDSKESIVSNLEKKIANASNDIESLTLLYDMILLILSYFEIDRFRANKTERYYQVLKKSSTVESKNIDIASNFWKALLKNENVAEAGDFFDDFMQQRPNLVRRSTLKK